MKEKVEYISDDLRIRTTEPEKQEEKMKTNREYFEEYIRSGKVLARLAKKHGMTKVQLRRKISEGKKEVTGKPMRLRKKINRKKSVVRKKRAIFRKKQSTQNERGTLLRIMHSTSPKTTKAIVQRVLKITHNDYDKAAQRLNVSRHTLLKYLGKLGLNVTDQVASRKIASLERKLAVLTREMESLKKK